MTTSPHTPPRRRLGPGMILLVVWNIGMLLLAMRASQTYESCEAQSTYWKVCIDLTPPILILLGAVDAVAFVIAEITRRRRIGRTSGRG